MGYILYWIKESGGERERQSERERVKERERGIEREREREKRGRERQSERVKKQEEERLTSSYQLKKNISLFLLIHFCVCSDTYFDSGCLLSSIH